MNHEIYPNLKYFFAVYFNQFWMTTPFHSKELQQKWSGDERTYQMIVIDFKDTVGDERVANTIVELEHLIGRKLNDEQLRQITNRELGSYVYPPGLDMSYEEWLEDLLTILKD